MKLKSFCTAVFWFAIMGDALDLGHAGLKGTLSTSTHLLCIFYSTEITTNHYRHSKLIWAFKCQLAWNRTDSLVVNLQWSEAFLRCHLPQHWINVWYLIWFQLSPLFFVYSSNGSCQPQSFKSAGRDGIYVIIARTTPPCFRPLLAFIIITVMIQWWHINWLRVESLFPQRIIWR